MKKINNDLQLCSLRLLERQRFKLFAVSDQVTALRLFNF